MIQLIAFQGDIAQYGFKKKIFTLKMDDETFPLTAKSPLN
jgi:hypothetical protein